MNIHALGIFFKQFFEAIYWQKGSNEYSKNNHDQARSDDKRPTRQAGQA